MTDRSPTKCSPRKPSPLTHTIEPKKHRLQHRWTFWFNPPNKVGPNGEWHSNVKEIYTFDTIEDFWRLNKLLRLPSTLTKGSNYHLFKYGITPEWEDPQNKKGGKWLIAFGRNDNQRVDMAWMDTLIAVIGEQLTTEDESENNDNINNNQLTAINNSQSEPDEICGVVIAPRKGDTKLALWTRSASDDQTTKRIGNIWKKILNLKENEKLNYQEHDEALMRQTSFKNPHKYII